MSADGYYFKNAGVVLGPADNAYLQQLVHGGAIRADTMVREGEHGEWVSASSVADISRMLEDRSPIPPSNDSRSSCTLVSLSIAVIAALLFCLTFLLWHVIPPDGPGAEGWVFIMVNDWILRPAAFAVMALALIIALVSSLFGKAKQ